MLAAMESACLSYASKILGAMATKWNNVLHNRDSHEPFLVNNVLGRLGKHFVLSYSK